MERYNEYKDSGVQWLGEIPSHWEVKRLASYFIERRTKVSDKDYQPLSVTKNGIFPQLENVAKTNDGDNRKLVLKDDFVINSRSDRKGSSGVSKYDGSVSLINIVLNPRSNVIPDYCNYILKGYSFIEEYYRNGRGIVADLWTTRYDEMKTIKICMPPVIEQQAIVSYLDTATAKIDEAIAQQQKMIDLLNERKQIIINNAVTKGLNPDAPMKDSGVEWIGEIPEHWEVMKLKHVTSKIGSGSTPRGGAEVYQDSGIMFLRSQNVYNDGLKLDDVAHIVDGVHQKMKGTQVKYNDILYNITGGSIGRCCCYDREDEANVNQHVSIVRPKGIIAKYLMYNLQSDNAQRQLRETLKGGNREGLAAVTFKEFLILTCPKEEQNQIVSHIERMFVNIDRAISNATKQISLLQERKQIIINDVVTGKVKVS